MDSLFPSLAQWRPMEVPPHIADLGYYIGTSGYHFDDWVGVFNPPKAAQGDRDRLRFYLGYFPFAEINNTFYRHASLPFFESIVRRSEGGAMFAVKVHREISHSREPDAEAGTRLMRAHVEAVRPLVDAGRFYSFLVQLDDRLQMSRRRLDYLLSLAAAAVSAKCDVHIEFRHRSWHSMEALKSLKDSGVGVCNTEIPPLRHAFPLKSYATSRKGYLRYSGRNLGNWYPSRPQRTSRERIEARNARYDFQYSEDEVRERMIGQIALRHKTDCVAVAYNNHYNAQAVENAILNIRLLNLSICGNDAEI